MLSLSLCGCQKPIIYADPLLAEPAFPPKLIQQGNACVPNPGPTPAYKTYYDCAFAKPITVGDTVFATCVNVGMNPLVAGITDNASDSYMSAPTFTSIWNQLGFTAPLQWSYSTPVIKNQTLSVRITFVNPNAFFNWCSGPNIYEVLANQ